MRNSKDGTLQCYYHRAHRQATVADRVLLNDYLSNVAAEALLAANRTAIPGGLLI